MAALTENNLKGYIIGTNKFNFQDARVDDLENVANIISRTQGQQGIEVRNNRLVLSNGGYYETGAVFEDVEENIVLDNTKTSSYEYNISGTSQEYLDWMTGGSPVNVWIKGSNGSTEIEVELEGSFSVDGTDAIFALSDNNASLINYGIQTIKVDTTNMEFSIFKDERNEDDLTLTEIAVYLPGSDPVQWPAELLDAAGIEGGLAYDIENSQNDGDILYNAIRDRLINDGYIQAQSQI